MKKILFAFALVAALPVQAQISTMDMEAGTEAKMARERAKQAAIRGAREADARKAARDGQCGSVEIGNFDSGGRFERSPREINVFIRGDVINSDNRCR